MNKPKRIQRKRTKGWKKPENSVIVDRTSKWGSPYKIEKRGARWVVCRGGEERAFETEQEARFFSVTSYGFYLMGKLSKKELDISNLKGKDLVCFCSLDKECHGDLLLDIANNDTI